MLPVGAILVDFDGTACLHDVAADLLVEFGDPSWPEFDDAVDRGEIGLREAVAGQDALLRSPREDLLDFAARHCPLDPTFAPFVRWAASEGAALALVSDGFGFYIEPMLRAAGIADLTVVTNEQIWDDNGRPAGLRFVAGHPVCVGCGTCKMQAALNARASSGPVAFIGEGRTDRYGALYSDIVFAKLDLPAYCRADGVPFFEWENFDDVRAVLEGISELPGPVAPATCPGWTTSA